MFQLWYSNATEQLVRALVENQTAFRRRESITPFDPFTVVIPNRTLEAHLKIEIARQTGIAANVELGFLTRFLAKLVEGSFEDARLLDRSELEGRLLELFLDQGFLAEPVLAPVVRYLRAAGEEADAIDLRRHQLAAELSRLFEEYDFSRPQMLEEWQLRTVLDGSSLAATERWQRRLWLELFGPSGRIAGAKKADGVERLRASELLERMKRGATLAVPPEVHVFGFSYLAQVFLQIFAALARSTDVHLYALNPSREFWEDVGFHPSMRQLDLFPRTKDVAVESEDEDPLHLEEGGDTPALRLWGRPGRESIRMLGAITDGDFNGRFVDPLERGAPTLLGQLQRDILAREPERRKITPEISVYAKTSDRSVQVLACPSIRREVEVVASEIWSLVIEDEERGGPDPLRFDQIAVLVNAREAEAYHAHIASVFAETHKIPHNVIDLPILQESRIAEAIELLLQLPLGRFNRQELLPLLLHPSILARFDDVDPEEWTRWCESLSIVHGADRVDHRETYIERDLFNWDQGVRRLVAGVFMTGKRSGDPSPIEVDAMRYLPEEVPESRIESAGRLGLLVRALIADARFLRSGSRGLKAWADLLAGYLTGYLEPASDADERVLRRAIRAIQDSERSEIPGLRVSYRIAAERARAAVAGLRGGRGQHLADGVVVASLAPMRAVPFRAIFVLGLGEGRFPASERPSHLDLRLARRRPGDVTPRERDKYVFLETLLAARERLFLSYVARDELTGETLQPSSVVQELLEILERGYLGKEGVLGIQIEHRLRRHDPAYFPELFKTSTERPLESHAPEARREAQALALGRDLRSWLAGGAAPPFDRLRQELPGSLYASLADQLGIAAPVATSGGRGSAERREVSIAQVRRFLECPLQGWARVLLGLRDDDDDDDPLAREDEVFATGALKASELLRATFLEALATERPEVEMERLFDRRAELFELGGVVPTGVFRDAERQRQLDVLASWKSSLDRMAPGAGVPRSFRFGRADEHAAVDEILDPIRLEIGAPDGKKLVVELHGQTNPVLTEPPASLLLIRGGLRGGTGGTREQKEALKGFLDHVVLSAAGVTAGREHSACLLTGDKGGKASTAFSFEPFTAAEAREYLSAILADLFLSAHVYLLPIEAVLSANAKGGTLREAVEELRERAKSGGRGGPGGAPGACAGPVPHPERFEPPLEEDARNMVDRRLGTFFRKRKDRPRGTQS